MKPVICIALCAFAFLANGQKLKVNKIDDFTGKSIKETSREMLFSDGLMDAADFRIRKIDSICFVDIRWGRTGIFSISKDAELILLMKDKSTYTLKSMSYEIASRGEYGVYNGNITYANPSEFNLKSLENNSIAKVRLYTTDGYADYEVKEKHAENMAKCLKLVNQ